MVREERSRCDESPDNKERTTPNEELRQRTTAPMCHPIRTLLRLACMVPSIANTVSQLSNLHPWPGSNRSLLVGTVWLDSIVEVSAEHCPSTYNNSRRAARTNFAPNLSSFAQRVLCALRSRRQLEKSQRSLLDGIRVVSVMQIVV
jgi:hypothetical protein